jgi:excisionase family DNA binding protein
MTIDRTTPPDQLPELMRAEEVAAWLGVSRGLVFEMAKRGELRSLRLGRLLRIPKVSLIALRGNRG